MWFFAGLVATLGLNRTTSAQTLTTTISTGSTPLGVAVNPATNKVYVANSGANSVTVFNASAGTTSTVIVGNAPQSVAVNPVTNRIYATSAAGVSIIDGNSGSVVATVAAGTNPTAVAINLITNWIYVANTGGTSLTAIDGSTNTPTTIPSVGTGPNAIAINPVTDRIYVASSTGLAVIDGSSNSVVATPTAGTNPSAVAVNVVSNLIYVANSGSGDVMVFDGSLNTATADILVGGDPDAVAANPVTNKIYVANQSGYISVIDGTTNTATSVTAGTQLVAMAIDILSNQIYAANNGDGSVTVLDGNGGGTTTVTVGGSPWAVAVNPLTNRVYVGNAATGGGLNVIDGAVNVTGSVGTGNSPIAVAANPASGKVYVANSADNTVSVINELTQSVATVAVGSGPQAIAINAVTNQIFVANGSSNSVTVIDGSTDTVQATVNVDANPEAIAVDPATDRVYVANYAAQDVTVIDGVSDTVVASVAVGANPDALTVDAATDAIYVANYTDGTVSVIDGPTNAVVATVGVGTGPRALDVNPITNKIYVANYDDGTVSLVNGATLTVDSTVAVGTSPQSVVVNALTNKIYVANGGGGVTTIDATNSNNTTTIDSSENFAAVALNAAANRIYAVDNAGNVVVAIDGWTNFATPVNVGTSPAAVAVDPITGSVYVANSGSGNATMITPNVAQSIPLATSVLGVNDAQTVTGNSIFCTSNTSPSFTTTVTSSYSPSAPAPSTLYYQIDGTGGAWAPATMASGAETSSVGYQFNFNNLSIGLHTVYVVAAYGDEGTATSVGSGSGNSPETGNITAYSFATVPGPTTSILTVDVNPQNSGGAVNFTAQVAPNFGAGIPSGSVSFYDGTTLLGQSTLDGAGHAAYQTSALTAGNHSITASYLGSAAYTGSTSGAVQEIIAGTPASVSVVSGNGQSAPLNSAFAAPLVVLVLDNNLNPVPNTVVNFTGAGLSFANGAQATTDSGGHASDTASASAAGSLTVTASVTGVTTPASFSVTGVAPPVLAMAFSPSQIALSGSSTLTFTVSNPMANTVALTGVGFSDNLPTGLAITTPNGLGGTCNGTATALAGGQVISLSGATIAANTSCTLTVSLSGGISSGFADVSEAVTSANGGTGNVAFADLLVESGVTPSTASLTFGSQLVGTTSAPQSLTLTNNTATAVTVESVFATGDFGETNGCGSIAPTQSCSISVTFTPSTTGVLDGSLIISNSVGVQVVMLSGNGVAPDVGLAPSGWNFGSVVVGTASTEQTITVTSTGSSALSVTSVAASGDFSETDNCASSSPIVPSGSCAVQVIFQPTTTGSRSGVLTIVDNAGTQIASLTGTGVAPGVGLSASTLTFGSQVVGTTSTVQTVALTNTGTSSLTVNSFTASGDFAVSSPDCAPPLALAQGLGCTLQIAFEPQAVGVRDGTVTILDSVGTHVVALAGTGVAPGVGLSLSTLSFGNQLVGSTSVAQNVTVTNTGTSSLTVNSVTASGDFMAGGNCVASGAIDPNATCTVSVTFSPAVAGSRSGAVTLSDTAGTHVIALSGTGVEAGIGFSPSNVSFGSQVVGTSSAATNVIVTNTGTSNLTINAVNAAGDFGETDTCGSGALAPNGTCTISVTFSPVVTGTRNGSITIADSLGSQLIALTGTGSAPGASLLPTSLTFGSQTVNTASSSQTVTVTNTGSSDLSIASLTTRGDFAETDTCTPSSPVPANGTCTVSVTFTPTAAGTRTGTVVITDGAGAQIISLTGTGAAPGASLSPATLNFGSVTVGNGAQSTANINLSSGTSSSLTVTSVSISGDYTFTNQCGSPVAPGSSCSLSVTFSPAVSGTRTGTALINYTVGTGSGQLVLALTGTGTAPGVGLAPSLLNFGSQTVGITSSAQTVTLSNTGTSSLTVSSISAGGDFSQTNNCPATIASAGQCTIQVTFTPTTAGARAGTITILDGAATQVVALSGTGVAAGVSLSSSNVNFGNQVVSTTSGPQTVTFSNTASGPVTVSGVTAAGDFAETNTCSTVASGNNCSISITFTPTASGTRTGTVTIVDTAGTQVIATTGTGTEAGVSLSATSLTYGSQTVGTTSAAQTVMLTNNGTSALTVSSFTTSGDFAVSSSNCATLPATVPAGSNCRFQVTFIPSTTGTRTGSLIVGDGVGTQVVSLTGTGSAPGVSLSPSTLNFGTVTVGTSSQQTANVMLDIATASSLQVNSVSVTGDYTIVNNCSSAVAPGGSCSVSVTFVPAATGTRTGTALINYTVATTTGQLVLALTGTGTGPGVSLSPSSLTFGSQVVGSNSSAQSSTLTNTGTSGLTGITITAIGDFSQTNNCGNTAAGANCAINVTFTPTASGLRTGYMVITDNAGTQTLALSGTGTAPGVSVSPSNSNFGGQVVGTTTSASTVTVTNSGTSTLSVSSVTASGDFAISNNGCGGVSSGGHCTFQVTFTPTATGTRTGTVTIIDSVGTQVVSLTGTGNAPGVTLSSGLVDFGNYTVGTVSTAKTVTLTNSGTSALTVSSFTMSGDYTASSSNCASLPTTLAVNGFCTFQVVFAPAATGTRPGGLSISDSIGTHVVALTGVGLAPGVSLSPSSLQFGSVNLGAMAQSTANINLDGSATGALTVTSMTASGDYQIVNNCSASVVPGSACSLSVTFAPTATGDRSGTVVINYTLGADSGQLILALDGTGTAAGASVSPSSLSFGSQLVGSTSTAQTVNVTNSGTATLAISGVTVSGDFAIVSSCGATLGVGISCPIQVTFTPTAEGNRTGTVSVTDQLGTQVVALSGTGTAGGVGLSQSTLNFGNQPVNTTSGTQTVTVTNTGNGTLSFTSISAAGDFSQTNTCSAPLSQNATCTISIAFAPIQTGTRNGTVALLSNAATQIIALTGNGTTNSTGTLSTTQLTFGPQQVGTISTSQQVIFTNTSGGAITVSSCTTTGDFVITSGCTGVATLQNGDTLVVAVAFQPTAPGGRVGTLQMNDSGGAQQVALSGTGLQPGIDVSPVALNFGNQTTNTSSSPQTVTLSNTGTTDLSVTSVTTSQEFAASSVNCGNLPVTVSAGANCTFQIFFSPTAAGTMSGTLTITDSEGTQTVGLTGTGVLPGIDFSQSPLTFGSQTVGTSSAAQITNLTNNGPSALTISSIVATGDYSVASTQCTITAQFTLNVGGSCDLEVTFSPAVAGTRIGALTVTDSDGIQAIAMSGNATLPGASLSVSNLNFGQVIVGASAQMTTNLNLSSSTTGSLQVTSITVNGNFTEADNCRGTGITVAPNGSCYVSVTFSPVATGAFTGVALLEYTVGSGSGELVLQLSGTGTAPGLTLNPTFLAFGSQVINTTSGSQSVQLTNSGTSGLTVSSLAVSGDFSFTDNCASVPAGSSCTINVTFMPTAAQALTGTLTITHDVGTLYAGVAVLPLSGTGQAPGVSLSPASVTFATGQTVNTSSASTPVTLTNNGTSALHITNITAAGDFSQSNTCSTVSANGTCTINVTFSPKAAGSRTGTVTIKDDAGTQVITLSGTGTAAGVNLSSASINFGSQTVDTTSAAQLVTITNNGGSTLTISSYQATGDFGVSSTNCTTVTAGGQCTLQITFSPTLTGNRTGSVAVSDNVGGVNSVQFISLSGQGTAPGISLSPSTLNFGSVAVGSSSQLSVTILLDAASDGAMTVNSVTVDGDFTVTNNCTASVNPGGQCSMQMTFTPTTTGARTGVATITYTLGTGAEQLEVALSGTGLAPVVSLTPPSLAFGSQIVGTASATQTITLKNTGNSGLTGPLGSGGPGISINGDFTQTNNCSGGLSVGGSCTITVGFSPATTGTRNGIINISDNLGVQTVALSGSGIAADVGLSPATLSFGSQVVATTSGSQSVTVTNTGASSLSFTSIAASGDFAQTNTCTSALAQNGTCSITVTFTPTTTGTRNGTVVLVDNAGTQVVTLTGTGNAPGVSLTATTLAFGSQVVNTTSASQSVTLTNSGTSSLTITSVTADSDFAEADNCTNHSPLAANDTCTVTVTFTPTAAGGRSGAVAIVDGIGTHVITLSGTGTAPGMSLSSSSLNFGSVVVDTASTPQIVTLTNTGTSSLSIASISASGDFSETDSCISNSPLPASGTSGNSCTITITFTPMATGSRSGAITITDGVGEHFIALTGTGNAPGAQLSAATLAFGSQTEGTASGAQTVTLTNNGTSSLTVTSFTTGGDFAVSSTDCATLPTNLAPAGVCTLQVTFTPAAAGTRTGTVVIADGLGSHVIALTGIGAVPGASLSPGTLTFGSVTVGSNAQSTVSVNLASATTGTLTVTGASISGDYSIANHCSSAVSAGGSCSLTVTFAPTGTGSRTGTALVNYTVGTGSGQLVLAISGTGTAPGVSVSPSSLSFGSQIVNTSSSSQSVTVTNNGTSSLTFTTISSSGDFGETNSCTTVASGNTCSIQVTFTPLVAGSRTGTVSIVDNAGTQTIALSGTGTAPGVTLSPTIYNFGSVVVNSTSVPETIQLTNSGTSVLGITSITASAEFADTTTCGANLAANGGSCNINATFTPAATGTRNGTITIVDGEGTHVVTLSGTGTAPGVSLTATSLSFSNQVVNTTSAPQSVTVTNNGTSSLAMTSVTASGDFAETTTCTGSIAQNGTCTISVTFTPTASGGRTGAITIVDSVGAQVISLSGTGTQAGIGLSPTSLNFGNVVVSATGSPQSVTLTNTGTSSLTISSLTTSGDYSESDNCIARSPLAASTGNCSITINFAPTATGTRSGAVTITDSVGTQSVALTGVGLAPGVQLSAATLTFANQMVNTTSGPQTVTLTNNGTSSLAITGVTASGDFAQNNTCVSGSPIAANGTCTITVAFTPTAAGARSGAVTISDAAGTQTVALSGTGIAPGLSLSPTNINFSNQTVSTASASQTVTLTNTGTSSLSVSAATVSGDFAQTNNCGTVATNGTCTLQVSFAPMATGMRTGTLTVTSSAGVATVSLSGNGTATGAIASQQSIVFGSQALGTTSLSQSITLTNTGTSSLTVTGVSASGDFAQTNTCSTLAAQSYCIIQVTFTPTATGIRNGFLTIVDSLANHTVVLSGVGFDPTGGLSASNLIFGSQTVGTTSPAQMATFTNHGPSSLTISNISATGDFAFTSSDCPALPTTLAVGASCTLAVTFSPATIGARGGELDIDNTNGTQFILLSGTATAPGVSLSPANLVFGSVTVGTGVQGSANVVVNGSTNGSSMVTGITISGDFNVVQNLCTAPVSANGQCALTIAFLPAAVGVRTGTAVISYSLGAGTGQLVLALSGTGAAPGVSLTPSTLDFGSAEVGTTVQSTASVVVDNSTDGAMTVTNVTVSGDFSIAQDLCGSAVTAGGSCGLSFTFAPSTSGPRTGIAVIDYAIGSSNDQLILALSGTGAGTGLGLLPSAIDFGSVTVGATSQQTANIAVDGNADGPATVTNVSVSGDFVLTANQCSGPIAPGGQCGLSITFVPAAAGARSGTAIVSYAVGSASGQLVLALSGTGAIAAADLSVSSLSFGSQVIETASTPQNLSVQNDGSSALIISSVAADGDFAQSGTCGNSSSGATLSPGNSCTMAVTFTPSATQTRHGTITIVDNIGTQTVALTGTGNAPGVGLSSSTVAFAAQMMGSTSTPQAVTLTNTGTSALNISSVTVAGDFALTSTWPSTLVAGANCTLQVTFSPTATGTRNGTITIVDNEGTHVVALNGMGTAPIVSFTPSSLTFSGQTVGTTSAPQSVTVSNVGNSPLTISTVTATGDFAQTNNCATLPASGNCTIQVTFTPTAAGIRNGAVTISGNALTQSVTVSGMGLQPSLQLSPVSLTFAATTVTLTSAAQTVTVSNTGNSTLNIASIVTSADFAATSSCPASLPSGSSCSVSVLFAPSAGGTRSGTLTITSNSGNSPQIVPLTGTGADYSFSMATGSSATATVVAGGSASYQIVVSSTNYNDLVSLSCLGVPPAGTCIVQPNSVQLTSTGSAQVTVTVTTTGGAAQTIPGPTLNLRGLPAFLSLATVASVLLLLRRSTAWRHRATTAVVLFALLFSFFAIQGCSGLYRTSLSPPVTQAGTYNLMLVGRGSDGLQRSLPLTLKIN